MTKFIKKLFPGSKNAGFTLIELLVVVLIIGILASVALPKYQLAVAKARASEALVVLSRLEQARDLYYMANGAYPASLEDLDIEPPASNFYSYTYWSNGGALLANYKTSRGVAFEWHPPLLGKIRKSCKVFETVSPQYKQVCFALGYTRHTLTIGGTLYYYNLPE